MKRILRSMMTALVLTGAMGSIGVSHAGTYPERPITLVVPFGAGTTDLMARFVGNRIAAETGQSVIVENKAGADGLIGTQDVLSRPADGYTFLVGTITTHAANVSLYKELRYDPVGQFVPVSGLAQGGLMLVVRPDFPAKDVQELIALARDNPGKYSYGAGNSTSRAGGEMFSAYTNTQLLHVPYKTAPASLTDLIGGQIDMVFADMPAAMPLVTSGRLRALGVSSTERIADLLDLPTIAEQGVPEFSYVGWIALFAKKGTPQEAIDKVREITSRAVKSKELQDLLRPMGWGGQDVDGPTLAAIQQRDIKYWADLVERAQIDRK